MLDRYGRNIDYMRVSVTDRCNLRCKYCIPHDGVDWNQMSELLTFEEIADVCRIAAEMGIKKIKLTGGEPLVRRGFVNLVSMLHEVEGIEQLTITTNGVLLADYALELKAAGVTAVNVSLDTLDPSLFAEITGSHALQDVLAGIESGLKAGLKMKINCVLQRGVNDGEWNSLLAFAGEKEIPIRFIELMPIGIADQKKGISNQELMQWISQKYGPLSAVTEKLGNGPAVYYRLANGQSVGFISPVHGIFCDSCNRLRLTSLGTVKPCLCYPDEISLKESLRAGQYDKVKELLFSAVEKKPDKHAFTETEGKTESREMSKIGG